MEMEIEDAPFEFQFREESVFLRRKYNYAKLPHRFLVAAMGCAVEGLSMADRVHALGEMALVSRSWRQAARSLPLMGPAVETELNSCAAEVSAMQLDVARAIASPPAPQGPADPRAAVLGRNESVDRLKLLAETLECAGRYVTAQVVNRYWRSVRHPLLTYVLLRGLLRELRTASRAVACYLRGGKISASVGDGDDGYDARDVSMDNDGNDNKDNDKDNKEASKNNGAACNVPAGSFDIVELSIRRLVHELEAMVPLVEDYDRRGVQRPDATQDPRVRDVIRDPEARTAWEAGVGAARCYADLATFQRRILFRDFPCARTDPRFQRFVAYHLNTPVSDVVTVYRFRTLVSEFGPYARFAENFDRYALRPGFVGLMNMVRAEEVLVQHYNETPRAARRNTVLIRYSRSKPDVLAFTALDVARRRITHRRNIHRDGTPIPISVFIEQNYCGYDLLPMGISDAAAACTDTAALIAQDTPYYYYVGPSEVLASYKYVD